MFTKWVRLTAGIRYGWEGETIPGIANSSPVNVGIIKAKTVAGTDYYVNAWSYGKGYGFKKDALTDSAPDGIYIGSGTDAESEDSISLSNQITRGVTGSVTRSYIYDTEGKVFVRYTLIINNISESDITITEIGKVGRVPTASTLGGELISAASGQKPFLLDRTLLETPLVIPAGESSGINYDLIVYVPESEP